MSINFQAADDDGSEKRSDRATAIVRLLIYLADETRIVGSPVSAGYIEQAITELTHGFGLEVKDIFGGSREPGRRPQFRESPENPF